jgi:hypothetical protein
MTGSLRQASVGLSGELMNPPQSTHQGGTVQFTRSPPPGLPPSFGAVRVGLGLGTLAINYLIAQGNRVGPYLGCRLHSMMLVPVSAGAAELWKAAHSECIPDRTSRTIACEPAYGRRCESCIWVDPLGLAAAEVVTDWRQLHHALCLQRSPVVHADRPPVREGPYAVPRQVHPDSPALVGASPSRPVCRRTSS